MPRYFPDAKYKTTEHCAPGRPLLTTADLGERRFCDNSACVRNRMRCGTQRQPRNRRTTDRTAKGTAPAEAPSGNMQADPHGGLNATAGTAPQWIYSYEVVTCSVVGSRRTGAALWKLCKYGHIRRWCAGAGTGERLHNASEDAWAGESVAPTGAFVTRRQCLRAQRNGTGLFPEGSVSCLK